MTDPYFEQIEKEKKLSQEIILLREEVKNLQAEVKYERELRIHGADYHKPKDYHSRLRQMIEIVKKDTKLTDIHDIVDEAQRRLVRE